MPNTRSAAKRTRADKVRHQRNLAFKSELKSLTKKLLGALKTGNKDQARDLFRFFTKRLDQAAGKKKLHRKTASRKKSRFARQLAKLVGA